MKIMELRPDQPDISDREVVLSRSHPVEYSWDATQPLIEPTSVTAGHTAMTNLSRGGL